MYISGAVPLLNDNDEMYDPNATDNVEEGEVMAASSSGSDSDANDSAAPRSVTTRRFKDILISHSEGEQEDYTLNPFLKVLKQKQDIQPTVSFANILFALQKISPYENDKIDAIVGEHTALSYALSNFNDETSSKLAQYLIIERKASIHRLVYIPRKNMNSMLHLALEREDLETVSLLLAKGIKTENWQNGIFSNGESVKLNFSRKMTTFMEHYVGAQEAAALDADEDDLFFAVLWGYTDIIPCLIEQNSQHHNDILELACGLLSRRNDPKSSFLSNWMSNMYLAYLNFKMRWFRTDALDALLKNGILPDNEEEQRKYCAPRIVAIIKKAEIDNDIQTILNLKPIMEVSLLRGPHPEYSEACKLLAPLLETYDSVHPAPSSYASAADDSAAYASSLEITPSPGAADIKASSRSEARTGLH